jgi:hypothetical protein
MDCVGSEVDDGGLREVHLDGEMVEPAGNDAALYGIVDEFKADETLRRAA